MGAYSPSRGLMDYSEAFARMAHQQIIANNGAIRRMSGPAANKCRYCSSAMVREGDKCPNCGAPGVSP